MTSIKIVILGAGYASLTAALKLQKKKLANQVEITLINKHHYHYQTIWLHRNAVGVHSTETTTFDLRQLLDLKKIQLVTDAVTEINSRDQVIKTENSTYAYDYLIIGLGSEIDSFQIPGLKEHAFSMTTLSNSSKLYGRLVSILDRYRQTKTQRQLQIVVGGGGFTGVELLGELTEQLPILCQEMGIDERMIKLLSIEHESTVLPEFDLELGEYAMQQLEARNVEFHLSTKIKSLTEQHIKIEHAGLVEELPVDLFIWTAGVKGNHLIDQSDFSAELGRVEVEADLTVPGYSNVFVIGDVALIRDQDGKAYLPNADIAIQKAKAAVDNLLVKITGKGESTPFVFKNRGTVASIGATDAIGITTKGRRIFGKVAILTKKFVDYTFLFRIGGFKMIWLHLNKRK